MHDARYIFQRRYGLQWCMGYTQWQDLVFLSVVASLRDRPEALQFSFYFVTEVLN
jgi:hypothetical protein